MSEKDKASTPHTVLLRQLLDSRLPKTEREHAAVREIERLREELRQSSIDHTRAEVERLRGLLREALEYLPEHHPVAESLFPRIKEALQEPPR